MPVTADHRRTDFTLAEDPLWWSRSDSRLVHLAHRFGHAVLTRAGVGPERLSRFETAIHRGRAVECPLCGSRFRHFRHRWNAESVICWRCGSHERHRALWLLVGELRPDLLARTRSLLHFAPEPALAERFAAREGLRYVTADIEPGRGELELDVMAIDLDDDSFDAVICSHVLEHVPDDRAAMRELCRIVVSGGWAIVMVPLDHGLAETREDPGITDPGERRRVFWQEDHLRLYGPDIAGRLEEAGFAVERLRVWDLVGEEGAERYRLNWGDDVFLCHKPSR